MARWRNSEEYVKCLEKSGSEQNSKYLICGFYLSPDHYVGAVCILAFIVEQCNDGSAAGNGCERDIRKPGNLGAFMLFLTTFIWNIGELIERLAGPPPAEEWLAYLGAYVLCLGFFFTPAALVHFTIDYPFRFTTFRRNPKIRMAVLGMVYIVSLIGVIMIPLNSQLGNIVLHMEPYKVFGITLWGIKSGPVHAIFSVWTLTAALIFMFGMFIKLKGLTMDILKNQIFITLTGFFIMFVIIVVTTFVPMVITHIDMYPLTTLAFTLFGITILYTIRRYRMFLVVPQVEEKEEGFTEEVPDEGVHEMGKEEAYNKFIRLAKSGETCLGFITYDIDKFREKHNLTKTAIFQISKTPGKDHLNPEIPEHLEMISFIITSFLEQVYKPIILIDLSADWLKEETKKKIAENIRDIAKEYGGVHILIN